MKSDLKMLAFEIMKGWMKDERSLIPLRPKEDCFSIKWRRGRRPWKIRTQVLCELRFTTQMPQTTGLWEGRTILVGKNNRFFFRTRSRLSLYKSRKGTNGSLWLGGSIATSLHDGYVSVYHGKAEFGSFCDFPWWYGRVLGRNFVGGNVEDTVRCIGEYCLCLVTRFGRRTTVTRVTTSIGRNVQLLRLAEFHEYKHIEYLSDPAGPLRFKHVQLS